ncbi:MAG: hypothetical protein IPH35_01300 [Rhodoferax sp.]|nr:hypothetical protein [Rhodoferax sp.]
MKLVGVRAGTGICLLALPQALHPDPVIEWPRPSNKSILERIRTYASA